MMYCTWLVVYNNYRETLGKEAKQSLYWSAREVACAYN